MCGIAGTFGFSSVFDNVNIVCSSLKHRGPDDYGFFKDNTFNYSYPESINIKGTNSHSRINDIPLFSGLRKFKVKKTKNGFLMTANNATQTWEITENGMVYTDEKWGDEEIFVQRKWKRITPLN